ncbi:MAG TPA: hypothetical protein VN886_14965 [Acidimicrobiales bacterium]|nr:hypothetical protein [Acidimicrobiales bacterium]
MSLDNRPEPGSANRSATLIKRLTYGALAVIFAYAVLPAPFERFAPPQWLLPFAGLRIASICRGLA